MSLVQEIFLQLTWRDGLDILLVAVVTYYLLLLVRVE